MGKEHRPYFMNSEVLYSFLSIDMIMLNTSHMFKNQVVNILVVKMDKVTISIFAGI